MSTNYQIIYPNPITKIQNINNTAETIKNYIISFLITNDTSERLLDTNERKGIIRKPSAAKPNMLETFKPTIHSLVPELKLLTDQKLYDMLEEDDDE